jgi:hypothetical protein
MGKEDKKRDFERDLNLLTKVYSAFNNNGYTPVQDSLTGLSEARLQINDLLVQTDLTRFIPTVVQTIVREALEPALLIVPTCFQTVNIAQGRHVQIGAVGAMTAAQIPETGEYPTQDLDIDGGDIVAFSVAKHGLQLRVADETIEESQWDVFGMWLRAAGRALARHKEKRGAQLLNDFGDTVFDNASPTTTADPAMHGTLTGMLNASAYGNVGW